MITKCVNTDGKFLPYGPTLCIPRPNETPFDHRARADKNINQSFYLYQLLSGKWPFYWFYQHFQHLVVLVSYDTITHLNTTLNNNELASFV